MSAKKNKKHLISVIQIASYMLKIFEDYEMGFKEARVNKRFFKEMSNQSLTFLKKEVKRLKRIK